MYITAVENSREQQHEATILLAKEIYSRPRYYRMYIMMAGCQVGWSPSKLMLAAYCVSVIVDKIQIKKRKEGERKNVTWLHHTFTTVNSRILWLSQINLRKHGVRLRSAIWI